MRFPSLALVVSALMLGVPGSTALAGVIVVDPANGPGTDFTSLADAIAASVSGDVLLLRTGTYEGNFVITGKSVSVVADDNAQVTISNSSSGFDNVEAALQLGSYDDMPLVVRGLTLVTSQRNRIPLWVIGEYTPTGHAFVEECNVPLSGDLGVRLSNRSPATFSGCSVHGSQGDLATAILGQSAVSAGDGPLACFGGHFVGGAGFDAGLAAPGIEAVGQEGGSGVHIYDPSFTTKVISGSACIGGKGGDGALVNGHCLQPGEGGDGVLNQYGGDAFVTGIFGLGDLGGTAAPGCGPNGEQGALLASTPPNPLPTWMLTGIPGSVTLPRVRREGEFVPITVQAPLDQSVVLVVGMRPQYDFIPSMNGVLVVTPNKVVPLGAVPFGGLSFQWRVPELGPGVESMFLYMQAVSMQSSGVKTLGQPSAMLMLDRSL